MDSLGGSDNWFGDAQHLSWLDAQREALLDFYQPEVRLSSGGYAYLDARGRQLPAQGAQLWLGARMLHCFSIAHLLGRPGALEVAQHGMDFYLDGAGRDHEHGGWYPIVGGEEPSDRKELYGQAHVLLAASSATVAEIPGAEELLAAALDVIDRRFWREDDGACVEAYDRTFTELDPYRGQNANMHLTEAYLAAYEATGDSVLLERAVRIARRIAGPAAVEEPGSWRLPEHFDSDWNPLLDFNRDEPRHPFRPYGSQPGHWLEWAKLLMQLIGQGAEEAWMQPAAERLFAGAFADAWLPGGGFAYTVDWDGTPVVRERFFWEPPEGIGAARYLWARTGDPALEARYRELWRYCDEHFIDHEAGSWFPELDDENRPVTHTWPGKADLYHAFQATLYAHTPLELGLAAWARSRAAEA